MLNLMLIATAWGPKHGGINAFNADLAKGLGALLRGRAKVFCAVLNATHDERAEAGEVNVTLVSIGRTDHANAFDKSWAYDIVQRLKTENADTDIDWWIGHDVTSAAAALEAPRIAGAGRTALIMHMAYRDYQAIKHAPGLIAGIETRLPVGIEAETKHRLQEAIFKPRTEAAPTLFAVGPLLRDALKRMTGAPDVTMLVPGFADISVAANRDVHELVFITFGRMDRTSDRIKQGRLAVAAFAKAYQQARTDDGYSRKLGQNPTFYVIGISSENAAAETNDLLNLAQKYADSMTNILPLPYDKNRSLVLKRLSECNVAFMLSKQEGFGLTGWEAIAGEVPLIVGRQSGLYRLISETLGGAGTGCLRAVDIRGHLADGEEESFSEADVDEVAKHIRAIAANWSDAQRNATSLKKLLIEKLSCTWENTARQLCLGLGIKLEGDDLTSNVTDPDTTLSQPFLTTDPHDQKNSIHPQTVINSSPRCSPHFDQAKIILDEDGCFVDEANARAIFFELLNEFEEGREPHIEIVAEPLLRLYKEIGDISMRDPMTPEKREEIVYKRRLIKSIDLVLHDLKWCFVAILKYGNAWHYRKPENIFTIADMILGSLTKWKPIGPGNRLDIFTKDRKCSGTLSLNENETNALLSDSDFDTWRDFCIMRCGWHPIFELPESLWSRAFASMVIAVNNYKGEDRLDVELTLRDGNAWRYGPR